MGREPQSSEKCFFLTICPFFCIRPPPELLPVLGLLERYMTPTLDAVYIHICHINTVRQAGFDPPLHRVQNLLNEKLML